jgi:hypothetical protein
MRKERYTLVVALEETGKSLCVVGSEPELSKIYDNNR